jgi:L-fuconate dehydratase
VEVVRVITQDVRFPTSLELDGSDAVNVDPDYSAAYLTIELDSGERGHAFVFTLGRGNDIVVKAIEAFSALLVGRDADELIFNLGDASKRLVHDTQMRWLGPEKGVAHMACGALVNALWDIRARRERKPLWLLLSDMTHDELVSVIDFTHISDALSPSEASSLLSIGEPGTAERIAELKATGYPAYATSPGWLGYSDEKLVRLSRQAEAEGFEMIKLKVGGNLDDDRRRLALARAAVPGLRIAIDANQRWDVNEAIEWINQLAEFEPYWVEEPTSTDDVLGHAAIRSAVSPIRVATGEAVANRIIFKQFLQAGAIDFLQLDAARVGGVNENIANLLLAKKFGVPVCPHAGGVGLCEVVQHYSFFDYAAVSCDKSNRFIEYVDHLHEHFEAPARVAGGHYLPPTQPGTSAEMRLASREQWTYPTGDGWLEVGNRAGDDGVSQGSWAGQTL